MFFVCRNAEFYFENVPTKVFLIQFDFMHRQRYLYDQLILCQKRLSYTDNSTVMVNSYIMNITAIEIHVISSQEC